MKHLILFENFDMFSGDYTPIHRGKFHDKWGKAKSGKLSQEEENKLNQIFSQYFGDKLSVEMYDNRGTAFYYYGEVRGDKFTFQKPDEPKPDVQSFFIFVYDDDWYVVEIYEEIEGDITSRYFECDGFESIEKLFQDLSKLNEARLSELIPNIPKELKSTEPNDKGAKLATQYTLKRRVQNKKARVNILWNDKASHNLIERVKTRTNFESIGEFNQFFKDFLDKIFPEMVGKEINVNGKYAFHFIEKNMTFIVSINVDEILLKNLFNIYVVTVMSGMTAQNVQKVIEIKE